MGGRKRKTALPPRPPGAEQPAVAPAGSPNATPQQSVVTPSYSSAADFHQPLARNLIPPSQRPTVSPTSNVGPKFAQPDSPSTYQTMRLFQQSAVSPAPSVKRSAQQPTEPSAQYPSAHQPVKGPASGLELETTKTVSLPAVFCCSSIHPIVPFVDAETVEQRSDKEKTQIVKRMKTLENNIKELPGQIQALETEVEHYRTQPQNGSSYNFAELKADLQKFKEDYGNAKQELPHHRDHYNWQLEDHEKRRKHQKNIHEDHQQDFLRFLEWAFTSHPVAYVASRWWITPSMGPPYRFVIQVTEDITERTVEELQHPKLKNLTLRTRLYAPLPNGGYCELESGQDKESVRPNRIQLGKQLECGCEEHKMRYFICLYVNDTSMPMWYRVKNKKEWEEGRHAWDDAAMCFFEEGPGVHNFNIKVWLARKGWGTDLDGDSFWPVESVNCIRAAVKRALGVGYSA